MREIKFRAWDGKHTIDEPLEYAGLVNNIFSQKDRYKVYMQYTGLKDKNGKEIYEGDIVKRIKDIFTLTDVVALTDVVEFKDGSFYPFFLYKEDKYEIIGNIHENSELLT